MMKPFGKFFLVTFGWAATVGAAFFLGMVLGEPEATTIGKESDTSGIVVETDLDPTGPSSFESAQIPVEGGAPAEEESSASVAADGSADVITAVNLPPVPAGAAQSVQAAEAAGTGAAGSVKDEKMIALMRQIDNNEDIRDRHRAITEALSQLTPENAAEAVKTLMEIGSDRENELELRLMMATWADMDAPAAMKFLDENRSSVGDQLRQEVLLAWAKKSPGEALAWARARQPDAEKENPYLMPILKQMTPVDPYAAFAVVRSMPYGNLRNRAVSDVVNQMYRQNGQSVASWAAGLEDGLLKDSVTSRVAYELARKDPAAAIGWAWNLPSPEGRLNAISSATQRWGYSDPAGAMQWIQTVNDPAIQKRTLTPIFSSWASRDQDAAARWLSTQPAMPIYDTPRVSLAYRLAEHHPQQALAWATSVADAKTRQRTTDRILRSWAQRDPKGAAAFVGGQAK